MGTSYTEFKSFGFWSDDVLLSAIYFLLHKEFNSLEAKNYFIRSIIEKFLYASTFKGVGCVPNYIDEFNTEEKTDLLRKALQSIIIGISEDNLISAQEFNEHKVASITDWTTIPRIELVRTAKLLLKLVNGELKTDAASEIDYLSD